MNFKVCIIDISIILDYILANTG